MEIPSLWEGPSLVPYRSRRPGPREVPGKGRPGTRARHPKIKLSIDASSIYVIVPKKIIGLRLARLCFNFFCSPLTLKPSLSQSRGRQ